LTSAERALGKQEIRFIPLFVVEKAALERLGEITPNRVTLIYYYISII